VPADIFATRRHAIAQSLEEARLDALLVSCGPNLRYLCGFTGSNGTLLVQPDAAVLFTDPRYTIQAAGEVSCAVRIARGPLPDAVADEIARIRVRKIGYEPARMTCEALEAVRGRLPMRAHLQPAGGWVEKLRMVKSPEEIAAIRRAVAIASRAFEQAAARAKPGMREQDLAAELEYRMRRLGAEKPSFETIVAAGPRSALPHAGPTAARIDRGFVVVDMGAMCDGYSSDMTRMLHAGAPGPKARRMYKAVLEAQQAAIDAVRPGISAARVDEAARRVLRGCGMEKLFVHSTGHGLGLEIHEPPRLGGRDKTRLREGMAVTIEPGAYLEGFGGVRIEDTVIVTARGCEVLTPTSKELRVL
jgi:Xaa-Pro aminopeptidase